MGEEVEIPTYMSLKLPTLRALDAFGGTASNDDLDAKVIELAGVTDEQLAVEFGPKQTQKGSKISHRLAWARTYLKKSGMIDNPRRAEWELTPDGREVLLLGTEEAVQGLADLERSVRKANEKNRDIPIRRSSDPEYAPVYEAADQWKGICLGRGLSLFAVETSIWTAEVVEDLIRRFIDDEDGSSRSFIEKLEDQMRGASQETSLLMAELIFIHLLPLRNVTLGTKRRLIDVVGSWAPRPFEMPADFNEPLDRGIFSGGAGFNTGRPQHLRFLIRMAQKWLELSADERRVLLGDPWLFKDFLYDLPLNGAMSQRNALLLMLFPFHFEDISSRGHKQKILAAYPHLAGDSTDLDRQLLAIREAKTEEFGVDFSWYDKDIRQLWDTKATKNKKTPKAETAAEALEQLVPDEEQRTKIAELFASGINVAHAINPGSWAVSFRGSGIFLNVGPNRLLGVDSRTGKTGISLRGDTRSELVEQVGELGGGVGDEPFKFPRQHVFHVQMSAKQLAKLSPDQRELFVEAAAASAERFTPFWKNHSVEALDLIRDLSGEELPDLPIREGSTTHTADRRAWIIRVKLANGERDTEQSLENGDTRVFWDLDVPPGSTLAEVKAAMAEKHPDATNNWIGNQAGSLHRFVTRVDVDDVVLMPDGSDLYFGTVTGDAEFDAEEVEWSRPVEWEQASVERGDVSPALYSRLRSLLTITEITELMPELLGYMGESDESDVTQALTDQADLRLTSVDDDLAKDLMLNRDWLSEIVGMLQRDRQLIFYGPPGTGKTYLARKLADHVTNEAGSYKVVQFHPSYSYEDFVEGFRPRVEKGSLTYELTPGPLKLLAEAARENPTEPYLLIIDEINRGNLAKIFGELYYLLEYRNDSLVLQYGSAEEDEFSLPKNLFVIGTMNTADRSIAMVDAAIRRRFQFIEFSPSKAPISNLLSEWLKTNGSSDEPARLLNELNERLGDADYAIGPSYMMNEGVQTEEGLERIWKYSIMPLLVEHFYGRPGATDQFELAALRQAIRSTGETITDADDLVEGEPVVDGDE